MELVTLHTHTGYTAHGRGSVDELVDAARAASITTIAITEHYPLSKAIDPTSYVSMPHSRLEEYVADVEAARERCDDIEILLGCELDWLGSDEDRVFSPGEFDRFEVVLGSVHFVDTWPFDDPAQRSHWDEVGADAIWKRYFEVWCECVSSDMPFTVMAHPDLVKKFGFRPSFDPMPLYRDAVEATVESGRMIELNTSGWHYACAEAFPSPALLAEFCRAGVACTVGTDAHDPQLVARDIEKGYRALYEAGYREVTVPTRDGGLRGITIE
ncbi:histidinol-phosphatase HisJ family protein [Raoultibacter massiliensis]|uniref:Histidinol-phosphatase n=1 Tax=Raoultibacter massiliensis TaxID=1852371 RepID=A0ABV1JB57_9ACTN|nr:histidinol-phosphatase HisJ family protein [Raoultibacter massiliensis]